VDNTVVVIWSVVEKIVGGETKRKKTKKDSLPGAKTPEYSFESS
jgi:hypothetical protein